MSNNPIFDDIMNEFISEDEDENEEEQYDKNNNKKGKHKSISSLSENMDNKIKDKLDNIQNEEEKEKEEEEEEEEKNKKKRRDEFGYFISVNDSDSEESNPNKKEKIQNQEKEENNSNNDSLEKEKNESQSDTENNREKHILDNESEEQNDDMEKEENSENNEIEEKNNSENLENSANKEEKNNNENLGISINKEEINNNANLENSANKEEINNNDNFENISNKEEINNENNNKEELNNNIQNDNENDEQNDLINELYESANKHENLDSIEGEGFRMNSFRPNPIPGSPKFSNQNSANNDTNNLNINNNSNNNNLINFTETLETKIEGDLSNKISLKEDINKNDINPLYTHNNNLISLGKMPNKDSINPSDSTQIQKFDLNDTENNKIKSIEDEEQEEEAFLEREEIKRRKSQVKKKKEQQKENKKEEEGKENVTEDEEDNQEQILNNINIQENKNEKENNINNNKDGDYVKKNSNNEINNIKVRNISIKLIEQYDKAGDSQRQSEKNSKNKNINSNSKKKNQINKTNTNSKKNIVIPKNKNYRFNSPLNKNGKSNNNKNLASPKNKTNKKELQSIKKNLDYSKNDIKPKLYEKKSNKNIDNSSEEYSFLPNINQKSREICEKNENRPKSPIGDLLYEDAKNKKEKLKQIYINQNNNIILNMNSKKINKSSYNLVIDRINKKIDNVIKKYSMNGKLSIVGMTQCLYELNLITELIKIKDNIQDINDDLDFVELQSIIESINGKDTKKLKEVEFLEQLWFIINPSKTQYINCKILSEFLKVLFSSNNNIKDLENNIQKIFEKYDINKSNDNNEIKEEEESFTSPLRDREYKTDEIWPLDKFIKIFIDLKKNMKAYKNNNYQKGDVYNKIIQERDKELTFEPNFSSKAFFYKHSKYNYNKENDIDNNIVDNASPKRQKHDFNKVYERFMAERDLHDKTLERLRQIKMDKELKMCTKIPKINKYVPPTPKKNFKNKTIDSEQPKILQKNKSYTNIKSPKYIQLYNKRKEYSENNINNDNSLLDENCTFKPVITDPNVMMKTFSNMKNMRKPKGYNEYIKRNRSILEKKQYEKKLEEDKKCGKNYEKIQKMKIKPFNITDLNGSNKKKKKINIPIPNPNSNRSLEQRINLNNDFINNSENEKMENIIDDVYITIDVKIPNGLLKPFKIYNRNDNDTIELVNNFCRIYSINEENKKIILKNVLQYKNAFFGRNLIHDNKRDGFIMNEDLDTITNTYSNNSNH